MLSKIQQKMFRECSVLYHTTPVCVVVDGTGMVREPTSFSVAPLS